MLSKTLFLLSFSLIFLSCLSRESKSNSTTNDTNEMMVEADNPITYTYSGTLPCADCPGIETTLTIDETNQEFALQRIYLDRKDGLFETTGSLDIKQGFEDNNEAIVYVLHIPGRLKTEEVMYLQDNPDRITLLSQSGNRIESNLNYHLSLLSE